MNKDKPANFTETAKINRALNEVDENIKQADEGSSIESNNSTIYIYYSVKFNEDGKSYYYMTDDTTLKVGDPVLVPVYYYNRIARARIVKIESFSEESVPFPLNRVKKIIRKMTEEEFRSPTFFIETLFESYKKAQEQKDKLPPK